MALAFSGAQQKSNGIVASPWRISISASAHGSAKIRLRTAASYARNHKAMLGGSTSAA